MLNRVIAVVFLSMSTGVVAQTEFSAPICTAEEVAIAEGNRDQAQEMVDRGISPPPKLWEAQLLFLEIKRCAGLLDASAYCGEVRSVLDKSLALIRKAVEVSGRIPPDADPFLRATLKFRDLCPAGT